MTANVTTGRRTVPALACTDNQLREIVARLQQTVNVLGNPAPAGAQNPPIATIPYPVTIGIDFELLTPFDGDGHAMAVEVDTDGTIPVQAPEPDPPAPGGSPVPPLVHEVCTWPGAHADKGVGARGHAVRRVLSDGTVCWWVWEILDGNPLNPPEGDFPFDDTTPFENTGSGPDATGDPDPDTHTTPHTGGFVCFIATTVDHWVYFGSQGAITPSGFSWSGWIKAAHGTNYVPLISRRFNDGSITETEWQLTALSSGFPNIYRLIALNGAAADVLDRVQITVDSPDDSWTDDDWNYVAISVWQDGDKLKAQIRVDDHPTQTAEEILALPDEAIVRDGEVVGGWMSANSTDDPPAAGVSTGDYTWCLDNVRFWVDRVFTEDELDMGYNEGVIE